MSVQIGYVKPAAWGVPNPSQGPKQKQPTGGRMGDVSPAV